MDDESFADPGFQDVYRQLTQKQKRERADAHFDAQVKDAVEKKQRLAAAAAARTHATSGIRAERNPTPQEAFEAEEKRYYARRAEKNRVQRAVDDLPFVPDEAMRRGVKCAVYMFDMERGMGGRGLDVPPPRDLAWGGLIRSRSTIPPNAPKDFHSFWLGFTETWKLEDKMDVEAEDVLVADAADDFARRERERKARLDNAPSPTNLHEQVNAKQAARGR